MFSKKLKCLFLITLMILITISAVSAEDNVTDKKTFTDIQSQIDGACENSTIELEGTYVSQGSEIIINKSVTITSKNGAVIDAKKNPKIFSISNVSVSFKNLKIVNAYSTKNAHAITSKGPLTFSNTTFKNNIVVIPYSKKASTNILSTAIYSKGDLTITDSTFINNYGEREEIDEDTSVTREFGAIYSSGKTVIINTNFKNGGISVNNDLYVENSTIINTIYGIEAYKGRCVIKKSNFTGNCLSICTITNTTISECNFRDHTDRVLDIGDKSSIGSKIVIDKCNFSDNIYGVGRTVSIDYCDAYIYNSNFHAQDCAIFSIRSNLTVVNSTFTNNTSQNGGAIWCENANVINSSFINNFAQEGGGAIYCDTKLTISNCTFKGNQECAIYAEKYVSIDGKNYTGKYLYFRNNLTEGPLLKITVNNITTSYNSGDKLHIRLIYSDTKNPVQFYALKLKLSKDNKVKYIYGDCFDGNVRLKVSSLDVGTYKAEVIRESNIYPALPKTSLTVKITKANTIVKAPKVTNKYKKSNYFKVTVKYKTNNKAVKKTYIKIKIDKKTYKVKTDSRGIAKFNTKTLKKGTHKVVISSGDSNHKISAKSQIKIK